MRFYVILNKKSDNKDGWWSTGAIVGPWCAKIQSWGATDRAQMETDSVKLHKMITY